MKAYFAGGCFWCVTPIYKIYGVDDVVCGYSGGDEINPKYEDVKAQRTHHRETLELTYDEKVVPYDLLLDIFLENVDPYDPDGQFIDKGHSYTLAIYYQTENEKNMAENKIRTLEKESGKKTYISIEPFKTFYKAEEEHQDYYLKNPEEFEQELKNSGRI